MKLLTFLYLSACSLMTGACQQNIAHTRISINDEKIISEGYVGNGMQWDPYQKDFGNGVVEVSPADWEKIYRRLDYMKPQFVRVMINTNSYLRNELGWDVTNLEPILSYCQTRGIHVMFGDWGWGVMDPKMKIFHQDKIKEAVDLLDYLVNIRGYDCIRNYNLVNEPNGDWSSADGDFRLWADAISCFYKRAQEKGLTSKVHLVGPDIAIWDANSSWWIDSCRGSLEQEVNLFDIHTYPSKITVNSGEYSQIIKAYRDRIGADQKIVMGEIGFKFVAPEDSLLQEENMRRAKEKKHASMTDSQMFVYDYVYGTDMADALFQTINSGYSGSVVWMLDDAMHSNETPDKLKVWGFWNILGDEYFGSEEENVRPWYYAWSLLCRYIPAGSDVFETLISGNPAIKAVCVKKGQYRMLGIVNVGKEQVRVEIEGLKLQNSGGVKKFVYAENQMKIENETLVPVAANMSWESLRFEIMEPESMIVYTDFPH